MLVAKLLPCPGMLGGLKGRNSLFQNHFGTLLPLPLVAVMLGDIIYFGIVSILSLDLGTFFHIHTVELNVDVVVG